MIAVDADIRQPRAQDFEQAVAQDRQARAFFIHLRARDFARHPEPDTQRQWQRAGTKPPLLPTAVEQRLQTRPRLPAHIERADAHGCVELVAGDAHEIDIHRFHVERDLASRLRCVGVEQRAMLVHEARDLGDGLDNADLVVDRHHRHQRRARVERGGKLVEIDKATLRDRQDGEPETFTLQTAAGFQHAFVLGGTRDDFVAPGVAPRHALDGKVVRFSRARGEDNVARGRTDQRRDLTARGLDRVLRRPAVGVLARMRIAERSREIRQHRLHHPRIGGGRRLIVEIDRRRRLHHPRLGRYHLVAGLAHRHLVKCHHTTRVRAATGAPDQGATIGWASRRAATTGVSVNTLPSSNQDFGAGAPHSVCRCGSFRSHLIGSRSGSTVW